MGKFIQLFSLTEGPSVSDTDCLGNHRAPSDIVTSENVTNKTHNHPAAAHTHTHIWFYLFFKKKTDLRKVSTNMLCVLVYKKQRCSPVCYVPAVTLHFNFAACICTTCCSDVCPGETQPLSFTTSPSVVNEHKTDTAERKQIHYIRIS